MFRSKTVSATALAGVIALPASFAFAQQQASQPTSAAELANECLISLNDMALRMQEDQFWLAGWGGRNGVPAPQSTRAPATGQPGADPAAGMTTGSTVIGTDPRGLAQGIYSPRHQIRALYSAARVLAHQDEKEGCAYVVGQLSTIYDGHVQRLRDAGVDPASVATWRQEQVALAKPLAEIVGLSSFRLDDVTGSDVRNRQDESLGTVSDVVIDRGEGTAAYILVARGGFLGSGEEHIAIPWDQLQATPGLDLVVIDRSQAELAEAPTVDPERFWDPSTMGEERESTDQFWARRN